MALKKKTKPVATENIAAPEETVVPTEPCSAWCFILGIASSAFCPLDKDHEGDHRLDINVFSEPQSHFSITWGLGELATPE